MFAKKQNKKTTFIPNISIVAAVFLCYGFVAQAASTGYFKYKLLEGIPGFFSRGQVLTDLATLVSAVYKFGIWTVGISAMFMMIIGGFTYMTSAGNKSAAGSAKGIITDSLIGLAVALVAYLFLYVINPDLIKINLNLFSVKIEEIREAEDEEVSGSMSGNLVTRNGYQIDSSFAGSLDILKKKGINAAVSSGYRSLEKQKQLIRENCGGYPPTRACNPPTCLLKNGPTSCPHTTGSAVDIWALTPSGNQAISQKECLGDINACFNNTYQKALIAGMREQGFCVLASEPWHFEKPKMSRACY